MACPWTLRTLSLLEPASKCQIILIFKPLEFRTMFRALAQYMSDILWITKCPLKEIIVKTIKLQFMCQPTRLQHITKDYHELLMAYIKPHIGAVNSRQIRTCFSVSNEISAGARLSSSEFRVFKAQWTLYWYGPMRHLLKEIMSSILKCYQETNAS